MEDECQHFMCWFFVVLLSGNRPSVWLLHMIGNEKSEIPRRPQGDNKGSTGAFARFY